MKLNRVVALTLLLAPVGYIQAQSRAANVTAFRASLQRFQSHSAEWWSTLAKIKVEELPVSYAEGSVIERDKGIAARNLDLMSKLSARVLKTGRLSDEINLLEVTHEMSSQLQGISTLLLEANVKDDASAKKY